jgi:hypothetical protein
MTVSEFKAAHPGIARAMAVSGMSDADLVRRYNRGLLRLSTEDDPRTMDTPHEQMTLDDAVEMDGEEPQWQSYDPR